ncbi:MAG: DUF3352 domain-containing protein [Actinomycetota bacterium]
MNLKTLISVLIAAALIAGTALVVSVAGFFSPAEDDALDYVPKDAAIYVNVFLNPSGPQKLALDDLLNHFPEADSRDRARDLIVDLVDRGLEPAGLSFDDDIDPWLGHQIAAFVGAPTNLTAPPPAATLVATEDPAATEDAIDAAQESLGESFTDRSYGGSDYETDGSGLAVGIVDAFLVSGTEAGFKAVVDARREGGLADAERFKRSIAGLTEDRLALAYFDFQALGGLFAGAVPGGLPGFGGTEAVQPAVSILFARPDGLVVESSTGIPEGAAGDVTRSSARPSEVLARLPADSWAAFGVPDVGGTIRGVLSGGVAGILLPGLPPGSPLSPFGNFDIDRAVGWMGDAGIFVRGRNPAGLGGGIVVRAADPDAADRGLDYLNKLLSGSGDRGGGGAVGRDFSIETGATTEPVFVYRRGDTVVAAYGDGAAQAALPGKPSLDDSTVLDDATSVLGDGFQVGGFVLVPDAVALIEASIPDDPVYRAEVKPWLDPLSMFTFGSKLDGERLLTRIVLGVR